MKEEIVKFYTELYKQYGNNPRSVGWADKTTQELRFYILSRIGNLEDTRMLDVGCGMGDFYEYLAWTRYSIDYTGIELVPEFCEEARRKLMNIKIANCSFSDFCKENKYIEPFDYVFASGLFAHLNGYEMPIRNMFRLCKKGIAFNMLHSQYSEDQETKGFKSYNPMEVWEFCSRLTNKLTLRQDYLPYDFTFYLYK